MNNEYKFTKEKILLTNNTKKKKLKYKCAKTKEKENKQAGMYHSCPFVLSEFF